VARIGLAVIIFLKTGEKGIYKILSVDGRRIKDIYSDSLLAAIEVVIGDKIK